MDGCFSFLTHFSSVAICDLRWNLEVEGVLTHYIDMV